MHLRSLSLGLLVALSVPAPIEAQEEAGASPVEAAAEDPRWTAARASLEGQWRVAVPAAQAQRVIDAAVEQAVSPMNMLVRGIASGRLRDGSPLNERIALTFAEERRITVEFSSGGRYASPLDRTVVRRRPTDGASLRVTQRLRDGGALEQVFQSDQGTRWYVYEPIGPDRMRLTVTTNSDRMPQPMRYVLEYQR